MITAVEGELEARVTEGAIVRVGGVSLLVQTSTSTLARLGPEGTSVRLFTHLHVREDVLALFGFASREELRAFEQLISVSGVGPKLALTVLAHLAPDALALAIANDNLDFLTRIPGIGKRTAGRMILELRGKLVPAAREQPGSPSAQSDEVVAALAGLGYTAGQIQSALRVIPGDPSLSVEQRIVIALRNLAPQ